MERVKREMRKRLDYLMLTATVIFWGTSFAAAKYGMGKLAPVQYLFLRIFFACCAFCLVILNTPSEQRKVAKKDLPYIAYLGFIGIAGFFVVQYTAIRYTTTVNASLLIGVSPILVALYTWFVQKERVTATRVLGIAMCMVGIVFILTKGRFALLSFSDTLFGDFLMVINAFMLAISTISAKKMIQKYSPIVVVCYLNFFALLMIAPLAFIPNFLAPTSLLYLLKGLDRRVVLSAMYLGLTCTAFGYYGWYNGIKSIGPARTAVFNYLNPLVASLLSIFILHEDFSVFTLMGGLLIIGGVLLNNRPSKAAQNRSVSAPSLHMAPADDD